MDASTITQLHQLEHKRRHLEREYTLWAQEFTHIKQLAYEHGNYDKDRGGSWYSYHRNMLSNIPNEIFMQFRKSAIEWLELELEKIAKQIKDL